MSPYSDDQLANYLDNAHEMITTEFVWPEMVNTFIKTLDGTTGKITVGFQASDMLLDYKQIKHVYSDAVVRELPLLGSVNNPLLSSPLIGYRPLSLVEDPNHRYMIIVQPTTLTGKVAIVANLKADLTDPAAVIPIDPLLHIWCATWMFAVDDGTNPGQADKYLRLYNNRSMMLRASVNNGPVALNPFNGPTSQWWEDNAY